MLQKLNKVKARKAYNAGQKIILAGDNVNDYHILNGWCLGIEISKEASADAAFDEHVAQFEYYLERELGRRAAYYKLEK